MPAPCFRIRVQGVNLHTACKGGEAYEMVVASRVYSQNCSGAPTPLMKTGHSLLNMLGIWWERVQKLSTFSYLSSGDGLG